MVELINVSFRYGTEDAQAGTENSLTDISLTYRPVSSYY